MRSNDEIVRRGWNHYRRVRFRNILVYVRNMPLAHHEAGRERNRPRRIVEGAAKNEQIKFFGGRTNGYNSAACGAG
jgi:hypothetical protein